MVPSQKYLLDDLLQTYKFESHKMAEKVRKEKERYKKILGSPKITTAGLAEESAKKIFEYERSLNKKKSIFFHVFFYFFLVYFVTNVHEI